MVLLQILLLYIMFDLTMVVISYKDTVNKNITPTSIIFINDFAQYTYKYSSCDRPFFLEKMIFFHFQERNIRLTPLYYFTLVSYVWIGKSEDKGRDGSGISRSC